MGYSVPKPVRPCANQDRQFNFSASMLLILADIGVQWTPLERYQIHMSPNRELDFMWVTAAKVSKLIKKEHTSKGRSKPEQRDNVVQSIGTLMPYSTQGLLRSEGFLMSAFLQCHVSYLISIFNLHTGCAF